MTEIFQVKQHYNQPPKYPQLSTGLHRLSGLPLALPIHSFPIEIA